MKALSLTQPWASLVVIGAKKIETRSWRTPFRGTLLIHASKGYPPEARQLTLGDPVYHEALRKGGMSGLGSLSPPLGAIIGSVDVMDCWGITDKAADLVFGGMMLPPPEPERTFGDYAPGRWGWLLCNPIRFTDPIPCVGHLSLWEVPEEVLRRQIYLVDYKTDTALHAFVESANGSSLCAGCGEHRNWHNGRS